MLLNMRMPSYNIVNYDHLSFLVSEWFPVNVGLRQDCVMSPWLFNVCMDGVT